MEYHHWLKDFAPLHCEIGAGKLVEADEIADDLLGFEATFVDEIPRGAGVFGSAGVGADDADVAEIDLLGDLEFLIRGEGGEHADFRSRLGHFDGVVEGLLGSWADVDGVVGVGFEVLTQQDIEAKALCPGDS